MKKSNDGAAHPLLQDKSFYVVLFACIAAVTAAAWLLFASPAPVEADPMDGYLYEADPSIRVSEPLEQVEKETEKEPAPPAESKPQKPEQPEQPLIKQPVFTPPVQTDVSRPFSGDTLVYNETTEDWRTHNGADYAGKPGDAVCAVTDGTVLKAGEDAIYGKYIILSHKGDMSSLYAGLDDIAVSEGQEVSGGTRIAVLGEPMPLEYSDGVHLHFAVTKGDVCIDPASLF